MKKKPDVLPEPVLPSGIPESAKWLAGEGAGSWFDISESSTPMEYRVVRYAPEGTIECQGIYLANHELHTNKEFKIDYPSHCDLVTAVQANLRVSLTFIR